jgi:hypothetical protein
MDGIVRLTNHKNNYNINWTEIKKTCCTSEATYTGYTTLYPAVVLGHLLALLLRQLDRGR